jgi:hypothetical protein
MSGSIVLCLQHQNLACAGAFKEIGSFGISSLGNHHQRRSKCLNEFQRIYGYMPLVEGRVKAVQAAHDWFW